VVWRCSARRADEGSLANEPPRCNLLQFSGYNFCTKFSLKRTPFADSLTARAVAQEFASSGEGLSSDTEQDQSAEAAG
jgi:hypothetical protein